MSDHDLHGDRIATTEVRQEGFYWVILGSLFVAVVGTVVFMIWAVFG